MTRLIQSDEAGLAEAARHLAAGELVALPTETVFGLGANARDPLAIAKVFAAKGRPADHPLIVHVAQAADLADWAADIPAQAWQLAAAFWPGPLTMILKRAPGVPDAVTGGQDSVGVRCPAHPVAQALLTAFAATQAAHPAAGVAAPSANLFGRISPTAAQHVLDDFAGTDLWVLDGAVATIGLESTIVDLSRPDAGPVVLRPGAILPSQITAVLGRALGMRDAAAPRVSGALASHYAPGKPLRLCSAQEIAALDDAAAARLAVLAFSDLQRPFSWFQQAPGDADSYGRHLYRWLRLMDNSAAQALVVESVPTDEAWSAVADRLARAAS
jgi:L-threonylcarbamoyladenylate synthase